MEVAQVKKHLGKTVRHRPSGDLYRLAAYTFRWGRMDRFSSQEGFLHQAELQSLRAGRSVLVCRLSDVEAIDNDP